MWEHHPAYKGAFTRYHYDTDGVKREFFQDAQSVIDEAKNKAEAPSEGRFVGSIPVVTYHEWIKEAELTGAWAPGQSGHLLNQFLVKKLKDSDYRKMTGR